MNMLTTHYKEPPPPRPERLPMLDFGAKRAGRAVADFPELKVTAWESIYRGHELWRRVLGGQIGARRIWAEIDGAVLSVHGALVEPLPTVPRENTDAEMVAHLTWPAAEEMTGASAHELEGDFTADDWADLGEEIGLAKRGFLATDVDLTTGTTIAADAVAREPMIRLDALSIRGNPMRPHRRAG
jgi:hypothetical protein